MTMNTASIRQLNEQVQSEALFLQNLLAKINKVMVGQETLVERVLIGLLAANHLYESGQYQQAAQAYQQLVDQGFSDSVLFYNLGNAYFKQGDYGRAILNYRRAELLAPRDADIATNLNLARTQIVDTGNEGFFSAIGHWTQNWLTLNEIVITVLVASLVGLGSRMAVENIEPEAVVVAQEVDVTSGPGAQYVAEFTLHNGSEVNLLETRGSWARLALAGDQMQGWVPAKAVETVKQ